MKKFVTEHKDTLIILIVSLVAFIFGCLSVGTISILIIGVLDILLFAPTWISKYQKGDIMKKRKQHPSKKSLGEVKKQRQGSKKGKSKRKKVFKILIAIFLVLCALGMIGIGLFIAYVINTAPTFDPDNLYKQESSVFYDINGDVYATLGNEKRENVTYDELPEVLINAIVATEDSRFFQHEGVDWARFLKATVQQLVGIDAGGASTITMQVSKNDVTQDKTSSGIKGLIRKFQDVYVSISQLEKHYTKEEILEFYVNSYYLGGGASGVEQACQTYFGKSVSEINLAEASIIAGLFQLPGKYDPTVNPEATETRRQTVLNLMVRHGYITEEEKEAALAIPVESLLKTDSSSSSGEKYQGFINTVISQLKEQFGDELGNPYTTSMEVWTTMDPDKQDYVNDIMNGETWTWENDQVSAGIAVIDVSNGSISAIGAGRNVVALGFNTAVDTKNQIGSTAKPLYDYGPGIEYENWSTYQPFTDEKYSYSDGTNINNWDLKYEGFLTARTALAHSRNVPALKAFQANSKTNIKNFVTSLGLHPEEESGSIHEAHAIGGYNGESPLTMAAAYASFANGGYYIAPYSYTKVKFRSSGEEYETKVEKNKVMGEDTAYMVYDMLITTGKYALGNQYSAGGATYAAKTGTTNFDDATIKARGIPSNAVNDYWVTGVSPDYAISVWYGYTKSYQTKDSSKDNYCKNCFNMGNEIYHRKLFQKLAKGFFKKDSSIEMPSSVVEVEVENETYPAQLPSEYTPSSMRVTELFKKGTEPTETSTRYSKLDNVTNLTGSVSNNQVTLSWSAIQTPSAIDEESLKSFFSTFWKDTSIPLKARKTYNSKYIGDLVYKVYAVLDDGSLSLVTTTSDTSVTFSVNSSSSDTYLVKTSYTIFTANMSDGAKTTIDMNGVSTDYSSKLNGDNPYVVSGSFTDPLVSVYEDGIDVTSSANITTTYKNSSGVTVSSISTSGSYTATYLIKYGTYTNTLTRTIVVP
jgi:penicillin-binding protein 1A